MAQRLQSALRLRHQVDALESDAFVRSASHDLPAPRSTLFLLLRSFSHTNARLLMAICAVSASVTALMMHGGGLPHNHHPADGQRFDFTRALAPSAREALLIPAWNAKVERP